MFSFDSSPKYSQNEVIAIQLIKGSEFQAKYTKDSFHVCLIITSIQHRFCYFTSDFNLLMSFCLSPTKRETPSVHESNFCHISDQTIFIVGRQRKKP